MHYFSRLALMSALSFALVLPSAHAADWPQLLGPDRSGVSSETGLARSWPEGGPETLWTVPVEEGYGGPAIRDGEVFVLDRIDLDTPDEAKDVLRVLSLATGEELWRFTHEAPGETSHNGSRTPPTVTDSHVHAVGLTGWLYCIDRETHELTWSLALQDEYPPASNLNWGYAQSPVIDGDVLLVAPQSREGFVVSLNKDTGKLNWKTERHGSPGYSSPRVLTLAGTKQVVMITGAGKGGVIGYDFDTGEELWNYDGWHCKIPIPHATPLPGDRLFITGEYGAGSAMIRVTNDGSGYEVRELYTTDEVETQIHPPIPYQGHLYLNCNGNSRNEGMMCITEGGNIRWKTRDDRSLPRFERGSLIMADELILNLDGRKGTLHLIEPSPESYQELAQAEVLDGSKIWAPLALSDGRLVLRSQSEMKCLDLR